MKITNFKAKVTRIFAKHGADGSSLMRFDHLPLDIKEQMAERFPLRNGEFFTFGEFDGGGPLVAVTNIRILQMEDDLLRSTMLDQVVDVRAKLDAVKIDGKGKWQELEIVTCADSSIMLRLEGGLPFIGLWNVLLFVAANNRRNLSFPKKV